MRTLEQRGSSYYAVGSDRLYLLGTAIIVGSYIIEAPLRFLLGMISASMLIYTRDVAVVAYVVFVAASWLRGQRSAFLVPAVLAILIVHTLIGVLVLNSLIQPLFGLKIFLPFLLGIIVGPLVRERPREVVTYCWWAFIITAIGVVMNGSLDLPWIGASFDTPLGERELSRKWWSGSEARLPGFTRASYIAAQLMLTSMVPILAARPRFVVRLFLAAVAAPIIVMTTSKAPLMGLAALVVADMFVLLPGLTLVTSVLVIVLYLAGAALPIVSVQVKINNLAEVPGWAESFVERMQDMWPRAFALYDSPFTVLIGRGLGGIGSAQLLAEPRLLNSADNLVLFLLVSFGLAGPIYLGLVLVKLTASIPDVRFDHALHWACGWLVVILAVGLTSQIIEDPVTNMSFGISASLLLTRRFVPQRNLTNQVLHSV